MAASARASVRRGNARTAMIPIRREIRTALADYNPAGIRWPRFVRQTLKILSESPTPWLTSLGTQSV
jgi:hypothetical protein